MNTMKRIGALLLAVAMLLSIAGCAKAPQTASDPQTSLNTTQPAETPKTESRQELEQIADLLGDGQLGATMTDEELSGYVEGLLQDVEQKAPEATLTPKPEVYDEEGAMKLPFDQAYPEVMEEGTVTYAQESLLVKLSNSTGLTKGLKAAGVAALEQVVPMEKETWYEAKLLEGTDAKSALEAVRQLDEVLLAEYNFEVQTADIDDYKHFDKEQEEDFKKNGHNKDQWHFHHCGIPDGYEEMETEGGDPSVVVAVIDTGVDYDHQDLKDNMWFNAAETPNNGIDDDKNGYVDDYYGIDLVYGSGSADDDNGHGTHVAGIIAARNNNVGVLGLAYNVKIMPIKAAMHNGTLNQATIAKSVLYAYEMGAEVINMSFGGTACSIAVQDALKTAYTRCVLVASAGNSGMPNQMTDYCLPLPNYPAALSYVLGVMSVDEQGVESSFTNWDAFAFNGVEYELYAPGENIMSTLPNDQYGYLSGTSMAAPIVAGMAAILRSEFADRDKYPTKFIYGQLASTSDYHATCIDPQKHAVGGRPHNLPQVVHLESALTKLPKPEVSMQDFAIFDSPDLSSKNNGDGVIDAGETIALGLTLRNRWGMSENTLVTIDTLENGISDPYVTIQNPTVDYGSVGTYSTQDAGGIYTDVLLTGWEHPFLIKIADDIPNDYRMTFHVTVKCENALDEADTAVYTSTGDIDLTARHGVILPSIIEEDMVLTKNNLYIIPNATVIQEGVTVRVEPGTHIQFWSDDPKDPYADSYIAYLLVNGKFLVEGTKEDPVYIYPSQLMDRYGVELGASSTGYVSLEYADVTNLFYDNYNTNHTKTGNKINRADHCTFRYNYTQKLHYRSLSGGSVGDHDVYDHSIGNITAKDCVFYKIGYNYTVALYGTAQRCIFTQCGIKYGGSYQDCVFLGNDLVDRTTPGYTRKSSLEVVPLRFPAPSNMQLYYRPETGTTYIRCHGFNSYYCISPEQFAAFLTETYGSGDFFIAETMEEMNWLVNQIKNNVFRANIRWDAEQNTYVWSNGTPLPAAMLPDPMEGNASYHYIQNGVLIENASTDHYMFELPGPILPTDITFTDYDVTLDLQTTYQLAPQNTPTQLPAEVFLYESSDESVLTVSETGLVTPKKLGTADVWVYSLDKAVKNHVTVTVGEYVALEGLAFTESTAEVAVGDILTTNCVQTPENTTRQNIIYSSSDEAVATVDVAGNITGISSGTAVITAACEGYTATMEITVYKKAASLELGVLAMNGDLSAGTAELPQVITNTGAEPVLNWRSTDPAVADIENSQVTLKKVGTTSLVVTDARTGLSASCLLLVQQEKPTSIRQVEALDAYHYVLLENGDLYRWDNSTYLTPTCIETGVTHFSADSAGYYMLAYADGTVKHHVRSGDVFETVSYFIGRQIAEVAYTCGGSAYNCFVRTADGLCYAWGNSNSSGNLGLGHTNKVTVPTLINIDGVVDIEVDSSTTWFLTDKGELYGAGSANSSVSPELIRKSVAEILGVSFADCYVVTENGKWEDHEGPINNHSIKLSEYDSIAAGAANGIVAINGVAYTFKAGTTLDSNVLVPVHGITDAIAVANYAETYYVVTAGGMLYGLGKNGASYNHMAGVTTVAEVTTPVLIPLQPLAEETVQILESNLQEQVLIGNTLKLTLNKGIGSVVPKLYADGSQVTVLQDIKNVNELHISRSDGFTEGVSYELVFEANTIHCAAGVTNPEEIRIAFTYTEEEPTEAPVVYESELDATVQRIPTVSSIVSQINAFQQEHQMNPRFYGNVILNPISTDTNVEHWLRLQASTVSGGTYTEIPLGGNYWGTTDEKAIGLQMIDYTDFITYARLMYAPYLTEAPSDTFPFVTSVTILNQAGEPVTTVGNEKITVRITFNRDMDTSIPLQVRFGSAIPYGDYEIFGSYVDARTWEATYTLNTLIENGLQFWNISNGCSATDDLALQPDEARFGFTIDTTAAQALIMQGTATDTGIELKWTQDDFDTLMGYNVYRSTAEDGLYTRLNKTVIPSETMEFFDDTVEPGVVYYYNFTVVKTDLTESEPSGKISIMSKDTMAPSIYHSPVANAFTGSNLVITATVTDNLSIAYANLIYRVTGTDTWKTVRMNKLNDKYSAIIPAADITLAGIEYYIEAFDGVSFTCKGTDTAPYAIAIQEAVDANALGDVNGDGKITNLDALILLQAINDLYNMTAEEFARADIDGDGELAAKEALRILHYVSGKIGSVAF